jgi:hypothetical protein
MRFFEHSADDLTALRPAQDSRIVVNRCSACLIPVDWSVSKLVYDRYRPIGFGFRRLNKTVLAEDESIRFVDAVYEPGDLSLGDRGARREFEPDE